MSSTSSYQVDCKQQINKSNKKEISKSNSEFESQDGELRYFRRGGREAAYAVEKKLNTALHLATRWNAIVLLDEADVFMEERSSNELKRNEFVSGWYTILVPS
jgi:hypothetical protein